jgi:tetratricopeptide (TPR) repeat protein
MRRAAPAWAILTIGAAACASSPPAANAPPEAPLVVEVDRRPSASPSAPPVVVAPAEPPTEQVAPGSLPQAMRESLRRLVDGQDAADAAIFRRAHEQLAGDDMMGARRSFFELVQKMPSSPLVPYAYLAFGDMFFADAEAGDPAKYALAAQAYAEVLKYPPPANRAYAYAQHQRGLIARRSGDGQAALSGQRSAIAALTQHRAAPLRSELLSASRRELALAYADVGEPGKAIAFFEASDAEGAPGLVIALGREYTKRGAVREAIGLYEAALVRAKGSALCEAAASSYVSLSATGDAALRQALTRAEAQRRSRCGP